MPDSSPVCPGFFLPVPSGVDETGSKLPTLESLAATATTFFEGAMSESMIEYRHNYPLDPVDVARVFEASGITRPTADLPRIARMFAAPSLVISAWQGGRLVGVSRSLTDYSYCCYLSDLAVDKALQGKGVGTELIRRTQAIIGGEVSLILLSAPGAMSYYPAVGFQQAENAFVIRRKR
jgi:GNAT superfamily N-acetyltransferase